MLKIGLTGMSGSGKSYVCHLIEAYGMKILNTDLVVHRLYEGKNPCTEKLCLVFGKEILNPDHSINRRTLANLVFSDKEKLLLLNATVHPFVTAEIARLAEQYEAMGEKAFIIEAPQLFEAGLHQRCDVVVSVIANHETCVERISSRDGISREQAEKRLSNQLDESFFLEHSDYVITNTGDDSPEEQVKSLLQKLGLIT